MRNLTHIDSVGAQTTKTHDIDQQTNGLRPPNSGRRDAAIARPTLLVTMANASPEAGSQSATLPPMPTWPNPDSRTRPRAAGAATEGALLPPPPPLPPTELVPPRPPWTEATPPSRVEAALVKNVLPLIDAAGAPPAPVRVVIVLTLLLASAGGGCWG